MKHRMKKGRKVRAHRMRRMAKKSVRSMDRVKSMKKHYKQAGRFATTVSRSEAREQALKIPFVRDISRTNKRLTKVLVDAYVLGTNTASNR